jgi:transposase InsO family protein
VEQASHLGHTQNCCWLASSRLSAVLEVGFKSQTRGRPKACKQRDSGLDLPHGCRESDLGSTAHPRRATKAGFQCVGNHGLAMGTESPEKSRSRQALDRIPQEHREAIAAMDFFTVPTLTFGVLYCFFVIGHDRRKILGVNVTRNPNALWIVQQMREAWPYAPAPRFLLFDRDSKFGSDVVSAVRDMGSQPTRTAFRSPWQNGIAERWVGSCRRDLLDHVIILNERHLKRLMSEYVRYYEDRTHLGLAKDTPAGRPIAIRSAVGNRILSFPRLGGLHHRYAVAA